MNDALAMCQLLKSVACVTEKTLSSALQPLGITYCQATVLRRLSKGSVNMSALAETLCCNKSNVTQIVHGLLRKKLLTKIVSPQDRRQVSLSLTAEGEQAVKSIDVSLRDVATHCFCKLSAAEKKQFCALLDGCLASCAEAH
ncbi:MAG: MarR family transcriptional regulator [Candidatus Peribacteraceae bacterium]